MQFSEIIKNLISIEEECDVNAITYGGLPVWPLIRMIIWNERFTENYSFGHRKLYDFTYDLTAQTIDVIEKEGEQGIDMLLFFTALLYREKRDGAFYNKIVDPFIDLFGDTYAIRKLEIQERATDTVDPRYHESVILRYHKESSPIPEEQVEHISGFDLFEALFQEKFGARFDEQLVINTLKDTAAFRDLFIKTLRRLKPKAVGIICYYYPQGMGLTWACNTLGIPSIDIQHGKQGKYHGCYSHWSSLPEEGYSLMPSHLWMWGAQSLHNVRRWLPERRKNPKLAIGGYPWLCLNKTMQSKPDCSLRPQLEGKTGILVSAQPSDENFPEALTDAIRRGPEEWIWFIRLHPKSVDRIPVWEAHCRNHTLENVEFEVANSIDLYALLPYCAHNVTSFSTTAYDALSFGLASTIIHPLGKSLFSDYIDKGLFRYAQDGETLLKAVSQGISSGPVKEVTPYIEYDPERMTALLDDLMQGGRDDSIWS